MGRCLLIQAKLSKKYWVRALDTATHIRNLTVSANSNEGKSPFELFTGKTARRNHLRVFGCTAYLKRKVNLRKLDSRSVKAKFIGYENNSTAYILQELATKKIIKARNVLFEENEIQLFSPKEEIYQGEKILESPSLDLHDEQLNEKPVGDEVGEIRNEVPNVPDQVPDQPQNKKRKIMKNNHFHEQIETEDLLKDMVIPIPSAQFNKKKP